jgi:hypothetical protein
MKNSDLTTIISGVLGVVLIAMATVVILYEPGNIIFAGSLVAGALGLNGYNAALLAPSPKQGEQIAQAVAAAAPQVPLVNITHPASSAPDIQVSSSAIPKVEQQGPQPIVLPQTAAQQAANQPVNMFPPQGQVIPFPQSSATTGPMQTSQGWQAQPPLSENSMPLAAISRSDLQQQ